MSTYCSMLFFFSNVNCTDIRQNFVTRIIKIETKIENNNKSVDD